MQNLYIEEHKIPQRIFIAIDILNRNLEKIEYNVNNNFSQEYNDYLIEHAKQDLKTIKFLIQLALDL
jgi:hypothetical protein